MPPLRVAIFPWGDVIETFLEPLGLDIDAFAREMSGGWLFGYVAALQRAGAEAIIVAPSERVSSTTTLVHRETSAKMVFVPGRRRRIGNASFGALARWSDEPVAAFRTVIQDYAISHILCQEYEDPRFDQLASLGRAMRIPVFATFQGGDRTGSQIEKWRRSRSMAAAAGLIIASGEERLRVARAFGRAAPPIASIANPLKTELWRSSDRGSCRSQLGLPENSSIAICHGRIDIWRKGCDVLIEAWRSIADERPGLMLVLIGSGPDHQRFAKLLERSGSTNIRWIDRYMTDREELRCWLSAADVYVSASRVEGMPVAPLEAMACGLPVVATDAQGLGDIIAQGEESGGVIVPREDVAALSAALSRLLSDTSLRRRLGRAAQQRVRSRFDIEPIGRALTRFLSDPGEAGARWGI